MLGGTLYGRPNSRIDYPSSASELPSDAASIYRTCSARLPTDPDAPDIPVLPNYVAMPVGVAIVEGEVEFVREFHEGGRVETDTRAQRIQIFDGAVMPSIRILRQDLGWLRNLRSWESPTFDHVYPPHSQSANNFLRYC
jgi:hypothetical protein